MRRFGNVAGLIVAGREGDPTGGWRTIYRYEGNPDEVLTIEAQLRAGGATTRSNYVALPAYVEAWVAGPEDGTEPTQQDPFSNVYKLATVSESRELWEHPKILAITSTMDNLSVVRLRQDVNTLANGQKFDDLETVTAILATLEAYPDLQQLVRHLCAGVTSYRVDRWVLENIRTFPAGYKWNFADDYTATNKLITSADLQAREAARGLLFTLPAGLTWITTGLNIEQYGRDKEQVIYRWEQELNDTWMYDTITFT